MKKKLGFTLIEMLLVIAIGASILVLGMNYTTQKADQLRRERTVLQIQQVLNAGLAYFVANGQWPKCWNQISGSDLENTYVPNIVNGWGNVIRMGVSAGGCQSSTPTTPLFYVSTVVGPTSATNKSIAEAKIIAGMLPMGFTTNYTSWDNMMTGASSYVASVACTVGSACLVVASVPIPGQNLNNARSVNFAGIYHSGACVPAPTCPANMKPAIYVVPTSISGVNDAPTTCSGTFPNRTCTGTPVYPVSSFKAFARGGDYAGNPVTYNPGPYDCKIVGSPAAFECGAALPYAEVASTDNLSTTKYWRVCLAVVTEKGLVVMTGTANRDSTPYSYEQGKMMGSVLAITRCVPSTGDIPSGSPFTVWTPNQGFNP